MSHTFYDSPEGVHPQISIDVTPDYVWIFQHTDGVGVELDQPFAIKFRKRQLPLVQEAIGRYLESLE